MESIGYVGKIGEVLIGFSSNKQRYTKTLERTAGWDAVRHRELVTGVAQRECAALRNIVAMAATGRLEETPITSASKTKVELIMYN